jgi:hypothetical protein
MECSAIDRPWEFGSLGIGVGLWISVGLWIGVFLLAYYYRRTSVLLWCYFSVMTTYTGGVYLSILPGECDYRKLTTIDYQRLFLLPGTFLVPQYTPPNCDLVLLYILVKNGRSSAYFAWEVSSCLAITVDFGFMGRIFGYSRRRISSCLSNGPF